MIFARFFHQSPALCLIPGGDKCMKSHAWEQRKLSDIAERITRKNTHLESTLPLTISSSYGLIDQYAYFNNRVASRNTRNYYLIKNGEFAYNKSYSDGFPFGSVKRLDRYAMGVLSTLYIIFSIDYRKVNSDFLVSYYDTKNWHHQVALRAAEGARNHGLLNISADDFFETELKIPMDLDEQKKIGSFFVQLNSFITLHQRKWVEFFYPTYFRKFSFLNFWEFFNNRITNAWEQRKIKDLAANTYGGGTPSTSNPDFWEGSIPWIQSSDLSEHNLFRVRPRKFISQAAVTNSPVKIIPESSIAVITRVGVGKLAVMNFSYTTSQDFLSLSNLNTDVKFTSYQLYRRLQKDLNAVQGTSIKGITKEELLGKNIFIPGRQEQEAIGKFFSKIDSLLTLHQRQSVSSDLLGASLHL